MSNISDNLKTILTNLGADVRALFTLVKKNESTTNEKFEALNEKVDGAIVNVDDKTTSGVFTVDFTGAPIQKYDMASCPSGTVTFDYANLSGVNADQASTIEVQLPIDTTISTINFPDDTQVLDMPEELEPSETSGAYAYHDIVFRKQGNNVCTNYAYKYDEKPDYFWVEYLPNGDGSFYFDSDGDHWVGDDWDIHLEYSYDGETWLQPNPDDGYWFEISHGDRIYLRSTQLNPSWSTASNKWIRFLDGDEERLKAKFKIGGNIMTLVDGSGKTNAIPSSYYFAHLFDAYSCVADASELRLPAKTVPMGGYYQMFYENTALSAAPAEIPDITTIGMGIFYQAFANCTHLTKAPTIKIKNFGTEWGTLYQMFQNCTSLNEIEVHFSDWGTNSATAQWVSNVASTGTFKCPASLPTTLGVSNIPNGWTIVNI